MFQYHKSQFVTIFDQYLIKNIRSRYIITKYEIKHIGAS